MWRAWVKYSVARSNWDVQEFACATYRFQESSLEGHSYAF
jgi:hypothetical protein